MAKKKIEETYHFAGENEKGIITAACDNKPRAMNMLMKLPRDSHEFDAVAYLEDKKELCPICRRLWRSYLTGRAHGYEYGIHVGHDRAIEQIAARLGGTPPGARPN